MLQSSRLRRVGSVFLVGLLVAGAALLFRPDPASAHCDSAQGPVVTAAMKALATGEIKWALAYVKPDAEAEMTAAFTHALQVRKLGDQARDLADRYFAETTVRLHRVGEGASYTGIKANPEITPALEAAEKAVESGHLNEVNALLDKAVKEGVEQYWHRVVEARERAEKEGTVEALREKAEAELLFEKFVLGVEQAAHGLVGGEEGSAEGGHSHGAPVDEHSGAAGEQAAPAPAPAPNGGH
ncbi:MAG TPA: DUF6448 family protein [Symbiobacteriaceae bacterium]|jgi:hypothetical protein|nr:DUF6448 family protein [Symbiobacteriaceae bacterium]